MKENRTDADTPGSRAPGELRLHPRAGLVPAMDAKEFAAFRADIEQRGLLVPIEITSAGVVLDGRERLRAARELGLTRVPVRVVAPQDEFDYMLRAAIQRRQLSASQRAALVVELQQYRQLAAQGRERQRANLRQLPEVATLPPRGKTRDIASAWAGVSPRILQDAIGVYAHDPALFEQVKSGEIPVGVAAQRIRRAQRDLRLGAPPPLPVGPFGLIYADPPWQFGGADSAKAPENHYPTMAADAIKQMRPHAAEDAVLFLWAVNALLPLAQEVMEAWGFTYRTHLVWVKPSIGLGHWARNQHELLLFGTRGNARAPEPEDRPPSVIHANRRRHSEKPEIFYELIERAYPQLTKLEMFARRARPGWAAWGNEAPT
jgi:N6-adenosine-specific RNA methylase IME4